MSETLERIVVTRRVRADPARVYRFFTEAGEWVRWQGSAVDLDARPGGELRIVMGPGGGSVAAGRYVTLDPFVRVVFTWGWEASPLSSLPPGSTLVTIDLRADGDGTIVTLIHEALLAADRPPHLAGWTGFLDRLVDVAEGRPPGPDPADAGGVADPAP